MLYRLALYVDRNLIGISCLCFSLALLTAITAALALANDECPGADECMTVTAKRIDRDVENFLMLMDAWRAQLQRDILTAAVNRAFIQASEGVDIAAMCSTLKKAFQEERDSCELSAYTTYGICLSQSFLNRNPTGGVQCALELNNTLVACSASYKNLMNALPSQCR